MTREFWEQWFKEQEDWFLDNYQSSYRVRQTLEQLNIEDIHFAHGCSKFCIVDKKGGFVIKWSTSPHYNEMALEYRYYKDAVKRGIDCFFPKTEKFIDFEDSVIYIQEMVDTLMSDIPYKTRRNIEKKHKTVTDELIRKAQREFYSSPAYDWVRSAISIYGKHRVKELCKFTREHKINDLHDSNVGFNGSYPKLLDFSGYHQNSDCSEEEENSCSF